MGSLDILAPKAGVNTEERDSVGGGGFLVDSGVYDCEIDLAYMDKAKSGAIMLHTHLKTSTDVIVKFAMCVRSGDAKGNSTTYKDKDGVDQYLPGYNQALSLTKLVSDVVSLDKLDTEQKVVKLWSFEAKAEVPTKVNICTDLQGKKVTAGIQKVITDKNIKVDDAWVPSGDVKEVNEVDKWFDHDTHRTVTEIAAEEKAVFIDTWKEKWEGNSNDKSKGAKSGATSGAPTGNNNAAAPATSDSLFD